MVNYPILKFPEKRGWVKLDWLFFELCFYFEFYKEISVKIEPCFLKEKKKTHLLREQNYLRPKKRKSGLITYAGETEISSRSEAKGMQGMRSRIWQIDAETEMRGKESRAL